VANACQCGKALSIIFSALALLAAEMAGASTLTVTSIADSGQGTLRNALAVAAAGDMIDARRVSGTIPLSSGELFVGKSVVIVGPGPAKLAVDGNGSNRVFHIAPGVVADLTGLTITNGVAPGDTLYPNYLGGGIYNDHAMLTVNDCVVTGNYAGDGGGLANDGNSGSATLEIVNSVVTGNAVVVVDNNGGGIYDSDDRNIVPATGPGNLSLQVLNSTLTDNAAETIYVTSGLSSSTVEIGSTILNAGASGSTIASFSLVSNTITSLGYNLSSDDASGVLTHRTDLLDTDPLLGSLEDNGGPTFTCALLPGSPAIDQGKNFSQACYDQRGPGFVRTCNERSIPNARGGDGTDIGAFEVQAGKREIGNAPR